MAHQGIEETGERYETGATAGIARLAALTGLQALSLRNLSELTAAGLAALAPLQQLAALNVAGCCGLTHEGATGGPRRCMTGIRSCQVAGQVTRYWMTDALLPTPLLDLKTL